MKPTLPVILKVEPFSIYSKRGSERETYPEAKELLQSWYNSQEKWSRALKEWQMMTLMKSISASPYEYETFEFERFTSRHMILRK